MHSIDLNNISDLHLNILAYGEPGCGKTRFLGSVAEVLYTLGADVDNGFKTLRYVPKEWLKNFVPIRVDAFADIDKLYKLVLKNDPDLWEREFNTVNKVMRDKNDPAYVRVLKPFEAIGIDTWSELNWIVKEAKRSLLGKQGGGSLVWRENIQIQDWGNILDLHQLAMEAFRDAPITFICNMHEQIIQDEKTKLIRGIPSLNGKLAAELGKYFDIVGHMSVNAQGEYIMETKTASRFQAKSRLPIDKTIKNPTFKGILQAAKLL